MTMFKKCRGIHSEKRLGSKMAWASRKEGVTGPTPTLSPSFVLAQAIFEPSIFSLWIALHFLNIVILHLSAYEYGTECSETSAYKIQTPGNYPEESIQLCGLCCYVHLIISRDRLIAITDGFWEMLQWNMFAKMVTEFFRWVCGGCKLDLTKDARTHTCAVPL